MGKSWRGSMRSGIAKFLAQEGKMCLHLFTSHSVPKLFKKADDGDQEARLLIMSLLDYFGMLMKAEADGFRPGCAGCEAQLRKGDMAAFAVLMPVADVGTGMVASFCVDCALQGYDSCKQRMLDNLAAETGVELSQLH